MMTLVQRKNQHKMTIEEIMADEYTTEVALWNPYAKKVEELAMSKDCDIDVFRDALREHELSAFEQGFIRGIAAVKGGAV